MRYHCREGSLSKPETLGGRERPHLSQELHGANEEEEAFLEGQGVGDGHDLPSLFALGGASLLKPKLLLQELPLVVGPTRVLVRAASVF